MQFLEKLWESVRKHRDIKLATTGKRRMKLFSLRTKLSYYKVFTEYLLVIE